MLNKPGTAGASRILLIEDNPGDVELLQLALQNAGVEFDMTTMDDGGSALAYFSRAFDSRVESLPALVILDMNLPKCDGLEILAAFGANSAFQGVPVALFSSSSAPPNGSVIDTVQGACYIRKPPDLDGFMAVGRRLRELLRKASAAGTE